MPKGALLHAHLDATVNAKVLLRLALQQPNIRVCTITKLNSENLGNVSPAFKAFPKDYFTSGSSITDSTYITGVYVPIVQARETFDPTLGGPEGFDQWIVDSLMIKPSEAYDRFDTTTKVNLSYFAACRIHLHVS